MNEKEKKYGEIKLSDSPNAQPLKYEILPNGCYKVVNRSLDRIGRCQVWAHGKKDVLAHRAVFEHYIGEIPEGYCILHSCDFSGCVNIDHMWLGTIAQNNQERFERGRHRVQEIEYVKPDISFTLNPEAKSANKGHLDVKINDDIRCWEIVNRAPRSDGYFRVTCNGEPILAHRWVYLTFIGQIPEGHVVRHKCNNRACVSPLHLDVGTQKDNVADTIKSGRFLGKHQKNE
jgi:hypothetical protein